EEILDYEYPHKQAGLLGAKQSVTEIKRRQELVDAYSQRSIGRGKATSLTARPQFLQREKQLTAAEIGTAMHTVMQHIPLTKQWDKTEIEAFIRRFVEEEKLTSEEASAIDFAAIEQFFQTSLASRMLQAERVEREVPFTFI